MKKYLLDTNICVYFLNGKYDLETKLDKIGFENCYISDAIFNKLVLVTKNVKHFERLKGITIVNWASD